MSKNIEVFIAQDQPGHIAMSGGEIKKYALRDGVTPEACKDYFFGISTVFPMMLLGHYYTWLTGNSDETYMNQFVPTQKQRYSGETMALLDLIYSSNQDAGLWQVALSAYLATYPYQILIRFAEFALTEAQIQAAEDFAVQDRREELPRLLQRAAACQDRAAQAEFVLWLGTQYAFDLLGRFHRATQES